MGVQDVRIVELIKFEKPMNTIQDFHSVKDYLTITYYDKIQVHPVTVNTGEDSMHAAYRIMESIQFQSGKGDYEFRQLIVCFADVKEPYNEFRKFWEDQNCPLFFVTMVNVSLNVRLEDEIERIRSVLDGLDYRLYLTYEYDEILIFTKSKSLRTYAERVMKIGFHKENRGVLDTITVCCFGDDSEPCGDEQVTISIQLGVKDYQVAVDYITKKGINKDAINWVLGRGDIGFLTVRDGLSWIREFYREGRKIGFPWLSTVQFSVMVRNKDPKKSQELTGKPVESPWYAVSEQRLEKIFPLYEKKCRKLRIPVDPVFERILCETGRLVDNALENRLSQDLAVCILPELDDFLRYLEHILTNPALQERHAEALRSSLNSFYLSILALVNSTVHSNQEFILIPHSAPPSFEMPPKVIVYYGLIVRQIIEAFRDDERIYGVMLAPKLVDDLEVESFSITELEGTGHLLSVSIGEKFLYNLRDTVMTLGHEMAHFVGEKTRERGWRRELILSYYLYLLLSRLCSICLELLPGGADLGNLVESEYLRKTAEKLSKCVVEKAPMSCPLRRRMLEEVKKLAGTILYDPSYTKIILEDIIFPLLELPECRKRLMWHLNAVLKFSNDGKLDAYLYARIEHLFNQAIRDCLENWAASIDDGEFSEYIGYLFAEAYADIAMVTLFEMSMDEYIHVFSRGMGKLEYHRGTTEDVIEMTRFIAVVRAAARTQHHWGNIVNDKKSMKWEDVLRSVANDACEWNIYAFCQENQIDVMLTMYLVKYLVKCAETLKMQFESGSQRTAVEVLHTLYAEIENPSTILNQITRIREQERECLDRLVPPQSK